MSKLFSDLQSEQNRQKAQVGSMNPSPDHSLEVGNKDLNKDKSKDLDKDLDEGVKQDVDVGTHARTNTLPPADVIEEMVFRLRKEPKVRVNGDLPEQWKKDLDECAHQVGVGRYHLVMYAVGKMLGKM